MTEESQGILDHDFAALNTLDHDQVIEWFLSHLDRTADIWHPEEEFADKLAAQFHEAGYLSVEGDFSPEHKKQDSLWVFEFAEWIIGKILYLLENKHELIISWLDTQVASYRTLCEQYG